VCLAVSHAVPAASWEIAFKFVSGRTVLGKNRLQIMKLFL
jgi:hypothetical protein